MSSLRLKASNLLLAFSICVAGGFEARAQKAVAPVAGAYNVTPKPEDVKPSQDPSKEPRAGIRIRVKDAEGNPIRRKRFYLLTRSVEKADVDWSSVPKRENYFKGASPELRAWLMRHDCDTLYCPEYEAEFEAAKETVPELRKAYAEGLRKYRSPKIALSWITVNFPLKEARTNFYDSKKAWLEKAEKASGSIASVMTDENGEAYYLDVLQGFYFVTNLIPLEEGDILWDAPLKVPPLYPGKLHSVSVELIAKPK